MTTVYNTEYLKKHLDVPEELLPFVLPTPHLLPGEMPDDYYRLFEMMATELIPDTDLEWLWTIDIAWLWFDVIRYRRSKNAIILTNRKRALEFALADTNPEALQISGMNPIIRGLARQDAEEMRVDANKRNQLTVRLETHGYDADAINARAFVQGIESLVIIEKFLMSARHQITKMVRDANLHREFMRRATEANQRRLAEMDKADKSEETSSS